MNSNTIPKVLILLAGCPGVGKSTIANWLMKRLATQLVDIDDFKRIDVDPSVVTHQIDPPELRWKYYSRALEHVYELFASGVSAVIMDEVFHVHELRQRLEKECKAKNIAVLWIEVTCPYEVVEARLKKQSRQGHILSTDEALQMHEEFKKLFDPFPQGKDNYACINNDTDTYILADEMIQVLEKIEIIATPLPS
jgi:predicted kinase